MPVEFRCVDEAAAISVQIKNGRRSPKWKRLALLALIFANEIAEFHWTRTRCSARKKARLRAMQINGRPTEGN